MALTVLCMPAAFTSCSDDDFTTQLEVDDNLIATGISAEIDGLVTTLGITSNDSWTITVPEEAEEWLYLPTTSGSGNDKVLVNIDANFGSAESRSTTLTIKAGDQTREVAVVQRPTYQGEAVANDDAAIEYTTIAANKGIGMGYDLSKFSPKRKTVVNLGAVKELLKADADEYGYLFTYDASASAQAEGSVIDSVETKKDSLGVALSFDISYGKFKMHIGGAYHGDESKTSLTDEYNYAATYNVATASTDIPSIVALYEDAENAPSDKEKGLWRSLLSKGFRDAKNKVEKATDSIAISKAIRDLVNGYGLAVVSECRLGGDIALQMKYDVDSVADILHVDTATVKAAVDSGLLKLSAGVEVSYQKDAITVLRNSAYRFNISGGSKETQDDVSVALSSIRSDGDDADLTVHDKISAWIRSINADESTTLSYTRLTVTPIWEFFGGDESEAVREWIKKNYPEAYKTFGIE